MSVTIRLTRIGKRNQPSYRIVVANTKDKRNGKALDFLGYFNPAETPASYKLDKAKYDEWVEKGALVTDAVKKLMEGTYAYVPYRKGGSDEEESTEKESEDKTSKEAEESSEQPEAEAASKEESLEDKGENK